MMQAEKKGFVAGMNLLAEVFPGGDLSTTRLAVYFEALKLVTLPQFEFAVAHLIKNRTPPFYPAFPVPGEIIEAAKLTPRPAIAGQPATVLIGEITPPDEAKKRLNDIFNGLNAKFGTTLHA